MMDRRMKESLDHWLTTPPHMESNGGFMEDDELNTWGMAFINRIDEVINELPKEEGEGATPLGPVGSVEIKEHWMEGNAEFVLSEISVKEFLTQEQMDWINDFLSEI